MSFSLFNLQREHYTTEVSDYAEVVTINSTQNCILPMYEIIFMSEFKSSGSTTLSHPAPQAPWKHHTVLSEKIPCTITTDNGEIIATWNWQNLTDIPEDLFIGKQFYYQGANGETITSGNSLIVDQTNKQVYLKRLFTTVVLTGDEPWEWEVTGNNLGQYMGYYRIFVPNTVASPRYDCAGGCTHFPDCSNVVNWNADIWVDVCTYDTTQHPELGIGFFNSTQHYTTLEQFKEFLRTEYQKGTPVTLWLIQSNWDIKDIEDAGLKFGYTPALENLTETHPVFSNYILNSINKIRQLSGTTSYIISTDNTNYKGKIKLHYLKTR